MDARRSERIAAWVAAGACLFFAIVAFWELFGPIPGGHLGNAAAAAMAGENIVRHKLFAAVLEYTDARPVPAQYYTHHPYGVFVTSALAYKLLGHGWATVRFPAALMSALTAPLVYLLGRASWGPIAGAVATVLFVVIPIDLAYASFQNLEVITIFFGMLFCWGTLRLWQTWQARWLVPATLGALGACQGDWIGMVLVGVVGVFAFTRAYVLPPRLYPRVDHREHARWFALATAAAVGTLLLYLALFGKIGRLGDLMQSYDMRSSGADAPVKQIFGPRRQMWMLWMLPWMALGGVALATLTSLARLLSRPEAIFPLAWVVTASVQYFVFRQGADVHVFWPHYYGPAAALGFGGATHALLSASERLPRPRLGLALALAPAAICAVLLLRVGLPLAYQSRLTGGRFDDGGRYIAVDQDRNQFAAWSTRGLAPRQVPLLHRSFVRAWSVDYALGRPAQTTGSMPGPTGNEDATRFVLLDARYMTGAELRDLASRYAVTAVGPFLRVDRAAPQAPFVALRYDEREPSLWQRYFVTGSDLVRTIGDAPDPLHTWEWQEHLGKAQAAPAGPAGPASTPEDARILYNASVSRGVPDAALRQQALALVDRPLGVAFANDVRLVGARVVEGAATTITLLWETGPAHQPADTDFLVRTHVVAPPRLWLSRTDFFEKEMAPPQALRPALWKPGRLYAQTFVAMRRIGTERFEGVWAGRGIVPKPMGGDERVPLFTLK